MEGAAAHETVRVAGEKVEAAKAHVERMREREEDQEAAMHVADGILVKLTAEQRAAAPGVGAAGPTPAADALEALRAALQPRAAAELNGAQPGGRRQPLAARRRSPCRTSRRSSGRRSLQRSR